MREGVAVAFLNVVNLCGELKCSAIRVHWNFEDMCNEFEVLKMRSWKSSLMYTKLTLRWEPVYRRVPNSVAQPISHKHVENLTYYE